MKTVVVMSNHNFAIKIFLYEIQSFQNLCKDSCINKILFLFYNYSLQEKILQCLEKIISIYKLHACRNQLSNCAMPAVPDVYCSIRSEIID